MLLGWSGQFHELLRRVFVLGAESYGLGLEKREDAQLACEGGLSIPFQCVPIH